MHEYTLADVAAQEALGRTLAKHCPAAAVIFLHGDLGAGKTTLARGFIRQCGHAGNVKSPTYTLIEPYRLDRGALYHLDLYRLSDTAELEFLGLRDLLADDSLLLVEWPERACSDLPAPDLEIDLSISGEGRLARLRADTGAGKEMLKGVIEDLR